jgi:glycosyltransferase involved in cell wall biosynthesis
MAKVNKVLMLVENLPAPVDRRVWAEAKTLQDAGYQVSIICPKGDRQCEESYISIDGIAIYRYRLPVVGNKYLAYIAEYSIALLMTFLLSFKVLFQCGFDVIHAANPPDVFFLIGLFYRLLGKKYIFDQHDLSPEMFKVKFGDRMKSLYKLQLFLESRSYRTAHLVITSNASQKKFAIERGHCCADKVFVVRNGPNLDHMKPVAPEPELKEGRKYLLAYVGVMSVQDGVEYALYALHELVHKCGRRDVSLVLMGDGDNAAILQALAHKLELDEYIRFTGWIEAKDILRYLTVVDVGLSPDPENGLNEFCTMIKTMEYMAMGKPVVAFDLAETRFSAQEAALYAVPNRVEDFANKIEMLLDNEELRSEMGALGRKRIEEVLNWDYSKKNLFLAYETLSQAKSRSLVSNVVTPSMQISHPGAAVVLQKIAREVREHADAVYKD